LVQLPVDAKHTEGGVLQVTPAQASQLGQLGQATSCGA
jgi:hypothetical protein